MPCSIKIRLMRVMVVIITIGFWLWLWYNEQAEYHEDDVWWIALLLHSKKMGLVPRYGSPYTFCAEYTLVFLPKSKNMHVNWKCKIVPNCDSY